MSFITRSQFSDPLHSDVVCGGSARHVDRAECGPVRQGGGKQGVREDGAGLQGRDEVNISIQSPLPSL